MASILIVEDERIIAGSIKRALTRVGHNPLPPVNNADDVLQSLAEHAVDLILMDINIEGETDGIGTALLVQENYSCPIIFLTARSDNATLERAKVVRPAGFVVKPYNDDQLRVQIDLALDAFHNSRQQTPTREVADQPQPLQIEGVDLNGKFPNAVFVKNKGGAPGYTKLELRQIHYLVAAENYTRIITEDDAKGFIVYQSLKDMCELLPPSLFVKVHRSHVVNLDTVMGWEESYVRTTKYYVPWGRSFRDGLKNRVTVLR